MGGDLGIKGDGRLKYDRKEGIAGLRVRKTVIVITKVLTFIECLLYAGHFPVDDFFSSS